MAAPATKNNGIQAQAQQTQASRKKKVKGRTESPAPSATGSIPTAKAVSVNPSESLEYENPFLKELAKNVRNTNKKLANVAKTESIVAANPGKSLDELVNNKIINPDQKAQILNKPALQTKLAEIEEQLNQYKKIHNEYQEQRAADKKQVEEALAEKHKKELEEAVADAEAKADKKFRDSLLSISQFLAVAAARRGDDCDPMEDENRALEGCLLQVYHGNEAGVEAMLKISGASSDKTTGVNGEPLETTYAQVKGIAAAYAATLFPPTGEPAATEEPQPAAEENPAEPPAEADSSAVNAAISETTADDSAPAAAVNGDQEPREAANGAPANASVADEAANAAGESQWNSPSTNDPQMSQSWVQVPRDPTETETGIEATPAAAGNTQSWSDEVHEASTETPQPTATSTQESADDGFTAVQRRNPRESRGDGYRGRGGRGRGPRDGFRGRGSRGDHRGRGRGGMGGRRPDAPSS